MISCRCRLIVSPLVCSGFCRKKGMSPVDSRYFPRKMEILLSLFPTSQNVLIIKQYSCSPCFKVAAVVLKGDGVGALAVAAAAAQEGAAAAAQERAAAAAETVATRIRGPAVGAVRPAAVLPRHARGLLTVIEAKIAVRRALRISLASVIPPTRRTRRSVTRRRMKICRLTLKIRHKTSSSLTRRR